MSLQAIVLRHRDTSHGPEAIVIVEIAENSGHKGVYFVQRSTLREGTPEYQIFTFESLSVAEACFGGQDYSLPAHKILTTDKALLELIKSSIGDPAGKPPGIIVALPDSSVVATCFYLTVLRREPSF